LQGQAATRLSAPVYGQQSPLSIVRIKRPAVIEHADGSGADPVSTALGIGAVEQVADRAAVVRVHPAPAPMLGAVMDHVTTLAERGELVERAVAGVVVEVGAGQHHRRPGAVSQDVAGRSLHPPALAVAPVQPPPIPPAAVAEVEDAFPVRAAAMLAAPAGAHEADVMGQLRPVDRVEEDMLGPDRHQRRDPGMMHRERTAVMA